MTERQYVHVAMNGSLMWLQFFKITLWTTVEHGVAVCGIVWQCVSVCSSGK